MDNDGNSFVARFRAAAGVRPDRPALIHSSYESGGLRDHPIRYADLDHDARTVAVWLADRVRPGDRVVLCYPAGPEFVRVFLGCLYAGVLPVPTSLPGGYRHHLARTAGIVADAGAALLLTDRAHAGELTRQLAGTGRPVPVVASDDRPAVDGGLWTPPPVDPDAPAFLQYTSGSTSDPKGVVVSQANLVHNLRSGRALLRVDADAVVGGWLPTHHDMGLIAMTLLPLMTGGTAVHTAPMNFLRRPVTWLELIDRHDIAVSAAPNFAYELCVKRISAAQLATVDLSRWTRACNGAEPIDAGTLARFADHVAACGFDRRALVAGYGMAETTLFAAGSVPGRPPVVTTADTRSLEVDGRLEPAGAGGTALVGCGRAADLTVRVVDPATRQVRPDGTIGEIWLRGPSVARGYWGRPEQSAETFRATTADGDEGFLRTGDLGVLRYGELYVTGRLKEMMIINGRNVYPQDVEREARAVLGGDVVRAACAFSVPVPAERLVVIAEVRTRGMTADAVADLARDVRSALTAALNLGGLDLVVARPGQIRKTTSGKVQRAAMRAAFLAGDLDPVHEALTEQTARRYRRHDAGVPV
ncbi:fatty acyl-AMP ligase [Jidongwangia harbinensis]|uniref:fatty acyl-AMP ligase n=1 Tax=Jidongwangia harbinensis TaxID=2878561 RepID=UPI001CD9B37C|nr:fatty acyl-AMP ligase [Jidongwangia harbinensis]MCA2215087.1 fatty acyl-AMP ligase [Jidongwangia harbinensis]